MKKVLYTFIDAADGYHLYKAGDTFPREGYEPTPEKIAELSGGNGNTPLIEAETEKPEATKPAAKRKTTKKEA